MKLTSLTLSYRQSRQPLGQYTADEISIQATVTFTDDENPNLLTTLRDITKDLKTACHARLHDSITQKEIQAKEKK
jgi:hypothetical protein